jgi:hypothetical protein
MKSYSEGRQIMPTKSTWKDVKTQLQYFDQAQLIELLRKVWQDLPESKLYLINAVMPGADISAEVERYRKIIVELIEKHGMEIYGPLGARIERLRLASQGFGWGFSDGMSELFDRLDTAVEGSRA